jgi:hypothetical protein
VCCVSPEKEEKKKKKKEDKTGVAAPSASRVPIVRKQCRFFTFCILLDARPAR